MTPKEALDILDETFTGKLEAKIVWSKALEKQIPKKPIILGYREGRGVNTISYTCPICHKHISRDNFCKNCGQALDWSDTE